MAATERATVSKTASLVRENMRGEANGRGERE